MVIVAWLEIKATLTSLPAVSKNTTEPPKPEEQTETGYAFFWQSTFIQMPESIE